MEISLSTERLYIIMKNYLNCRLANYMYIDKNIIIDLKSKCPMKIS